ncbi:hypothetical protein HC766_01450 [Candidatus Gracilibacteria bacterium]|nr:hypothetical protein [Candidatus Gracilibacteria bacterium]NJS41039.1 hypothetical protein [Candidatus Gracilibacteria bacterium]
MISLTPVLVGLVFDVTRSFTIKCLIPLILGLIMLMLLGLIPSMNISTDAKYFLIQVISILSVGAYVHFLNNIIQNKALQFSR